MLPKEESPILSGTMQCAEASLISVQTVQVRLAARRFLHRFSRNMANRIAE